MWMLNVTLSGACKKSIYRSNTAAAETQKHCVVSSAAGTLSEGENINKPPVLNPQQDEKSS